jgi:hypothetical protein
MPDTETEPGEKYTSADIEPGKKYTSADIEPGKTSAPVDIEPELFANGPCDRTMPVKEIIESFDFGQFVDLVIVNDNVPPFNKPIPITVSKISNKLFNSKLTKMLSENTSKTKIRPIDVLDGISIMDLVKGNSEDLLKPIIVKNVHISDIDDFLVERKVDHEDKKVTVDLDTEQVADLLDGNHVVISPISKKDNTFMRLIPERSDVKTFATDPAVTAHTILDLPSFLNTPFVPGHNGKPYHIELSPEIIHDLRTKGTANITEKNKDITLSVGKVYD